ncbi:hypothetical protein SRHO_G00192150 [Serrasalmus rhombeus]
MNKIRVEQQQTWRRSELVKIKSGKMGIRENWNQARSDSGKTIWPRSKSDKIGISSFQPKHDTAQRAGDAPRTARAPADHLLRSSRASGGAFSFWKLLHSRYRLDKSIKSRPGTDRYELPLSGSRTERRLACVRACMWTYRREARDSSSRRETR